LHHPILPIPRKPYTMNWLPERLIVSHYEKDYGAAVRSLNALRDRLAAMDLSSIAPAEMRALKREELAAVGSVILHDHYFLNLGGDGKVPATVPTALERDFGSVRQWRQEFLADARSLAGGPGWVVLTYSPYDGRLYNQIAIDHSHAMVGAVPILVLDMYEHAYHLEFGANAAAYVDVFMRIIDWTIVSERLMGATGGGQRHEAEAGKETLPSISVDELHTVMQSEQPFRSWTRDRGTTSRRTPTRCRTRSGVIRNEWTSGVASSRPKRPCSCIAPTASKSGAA
jgi:superoxide dismutase, Fe-Mn family